MFDLHANSWHPRLANLAFLPFPKSCLNKRSICFQEIFQRKQHIFLLPFRFWLQDCYHLPNLPPLLNNLHSQHLLSLTPRAAFIPQFEDFLFESFLTCHEIFKSLLPLYNLSQALFYSLLIAACLDSELSATFTL